MKTAFLTFLALSASAAAAGPPAGEALFEKHCAPCHAAGFGHPGTQELAVKRGKPLSVLQMRNDLKADYIVTVVRHGNVDMPAYRPTEISDQELGAIAHYLAGNGSKKDARQPP